MKRDNESSSSTHRAWLATAAILTVATASVVTSQGCLIDECDNGLCGSGTAGNGGAVGGGGSGAGGGGAATGGGGGAGGAEPCDGSCQAPTPHCDADTNSCVACLGHGDCSDPAAARCETGTCVPCADAAECVGVDNAALCESGACVECALSDESACGGGQSCDLLAEQCVDVAPATVDTCEACTNDAQCIAGHKCVPLDFPTGTPHGYFCLAPFPPSCVQPYVGVIGKESINGAAAANYCGVAEDLATCEAVLALVDSWHCTGTPGMCSQDFGGTEVPVPGAICRDLLAGASTNRCTYQCATDGECPAAGNGRFCGDEAGSNPPAFCGGDIN